MSEVNESMRVIADWLVPYGWKIYYNRVNYEGYPTFKSKGGGGKPDILITKNDYNVLIEVKPCVKHHDILDGVDQVLRYAGEYYSGRTRYLTTHEIKINAFVLATKYSPSGFLYSLEAQLNCLPYIALAEQRGMTEKPITHTTTRFLWRQWHTGLAHTYYENFRRGKTTSGLVLPSKPLVGTLLAKIESVTEHASLDPYLYLNPNQFIPIGYDKIYAFEG